ncbi:MAG: CDP-alcohol phosphatidyltransferase family protein [Syntrophorhabdaceae bacterium]|nr:CDP-alcohol phosphatidyltransferase family protein [Syntrophorhabdaceae bacterium]
MAGKNRFDQTRLINIANCLTALRVLLVPLFVYLLLAGRGKEALVVFVICGVTDAFDGILARRLRLRTKVGAYLDAIADKILMATSFIVLAYINVAPLWLAVLVISRDIFILVGGALFLMLINHTDIKPTQISKLNTTVQIVTVVYFLAYAAFPELRLWNFMSIREYCALTLLIVFVCATTTAVSGAQYLYIGLKTLSNENEQ